MIPSALAGQLQQGLADFLRFSFWSSTPGMEHVIDDLLAEPGSLLKGPYVSVKLPFVAGTHPDSFSNVPLAFTPHLHQEQAFRRLGGRRKLSTLVATGTGSGKTECFLLPILDHCLTEAGTPGIKAILIYPMNALANDQAGRIARLIFDNDKLRGKLTAGLYIGDDGGAKTGGEKRMGPKTVITDRLTLKESPPDILLTNYKMLDYLLLRPRDQGIWQHNLRGTLRFLVVDEIHTFDGAQGTDLACLIRRIKRRLQVDDGSLCCVGTSATLGGSGAKAELRRYAAAVFGEPFDDHALIGESRLSEADYLADTPAEWTSEPGPGDQASLDPARATDPEAWLDLQVGLWFGELHTAPDRQTWSVTLGQRLKRHAAFQELLLALAGHTVDLDTLVAHLGRQRSPWRQDAGFGRLALLSLLALVSAARTRRAELPPVAQRRQDRGQPPPVAPFLDVRLQLWQRELRRMVASVGERPRLRHSMDLDKKTRRRHLPLVHCRECGAMGWGTVVQRDKPHLLATDLNTFYRAFFGGDSQVQFLFPAAARPRQDPTWKLPAFLLDTETLNKVGADDEPDGSVLEVVPSPNVRSTSEGLELSRDCPFCRARDSLTIVGFQAATLTSVSIDQLFASPFNDDKKLLTFSDSVQDAAHRAGFFGARTWRTNLRIAMVQLIHQRPGLTLAELADRLGTRGRAGQEGEEKPDPPDAASWISTFLAPNMAWLHDWGSLQAHGELPKDSDLEALIAQRLAYEVVTEFGLQAGIGRSLPRTGTATVALDGKRLDEAVRSLTEPLRNEVPGLREVSPEAIRSFLVGLLYYLRTRGGILARSLPPGYVESSGRDFHVFKRTKALPVYGRTSRLPAFLTDRARSSRFETWVGKGESSWYARWVPSSFASGQALTADAASTYPVVLRALVAADLLREEVGKKGESVWGLNEAALVVTPHVVAAACGQCGHLVHVAGEERATWSQVPCLTARCRGSYTASPEPVQDYFGRLYRSGHLQRIFTCEHTGLLDKSERERVEREFKARPGAPDDPEARKPWFANLLSCTPTLEMGIDIGDLSTAILCSVPPRQTQYLQRMGRAGRRDGNALVLTVAGAKPHDLYFFAEPASMMEGEVTPPGVFLDAPAVLERQLTAFCVDRWVATEGGSDLLPPLLGTVFSHLRGQDSNPEPADSEDFPFNLLGFVKQEQPTLLREFREMFSGAISPATEAHLQRFMVGTDDGEAGLRWTLLDTLYRERRQRDSLVRRAGDLRDEIKRLKAATAQALDHEEQVEQREAEKDALLALVEAINSRQTLEFLTDEGLLPNYAFPESAVRLSSVIWRRKKTVPSKGSHYETWSYEYKRSPSSALSELAPHSDFYAGGRRVKIDQVDVAVSKVETWRFCNDCNHAATIDIGDEARACPACSSRSWCDDGQKFRLLKLQQVFANAPDRESRIRDDRDERQPKFFQRQILVDIQDEDRAGAWRIDDDQLPFGFELLKRATFREVNFGEPSDQGAKSTIAGREGVRPGFELCARCGKVQQPGNDPQHTLSCPSRKEGASQKMESCLYLYREFASEALRLLLPMTDLGTTRQLNSFVAALQLGFKERFGGSIDHLRTTVYSDPVAGSPLRRQYLVLYDTVPGGTGYIKQLVTPLTEGGPPLLFEAMELARQRIEGCRCWDEPERDGCYSCLYAYRNAQDMDDTSAQVASELLRQILAGQERLSQIQSLGEISISGLMDSDLERRFVEALYLIKDKTATSPKVKRAFVNQKPGFLWTLGEAEWQVEPQVTPPLAESGGLPVSIDFVMRPAKARSERRLAIFLDGWAYHKDRMGKDLRQRMALLASGAWDVWSFTWADVDDKLSGDSTQEVLELAVPDPGALKAKLLERTDLAPYKDLARQSVFDWFEAELAGPGLPWGALAKAVLAARMDHARVVDADHWARFVKRSAPSAAQSGLLRLTPRLLCEDRAATNRFFAMMAVHDGSESGLLASVDDRDENLEAAEFKAAWHGYLRFFQLLRQAPNAWFVTHRGKLDGIGYGAIAAIRDGTPDDLTWGRAGEIGADYQDLAQKLMARGVREPEVGMEVPDRRGGAWVEAELLWEQERVAVTCRAATADAQGKAASDWVVFLVEDLALDPTPVIHALKGREES